MKDILQLASMATRQSVGHAFAVVVAIVIPVIVVAGRGVAQTPRLVRHSAPPDPLGDLVVTPGAARPLPRIGVALSLSADAADVLVRSLVTRDLDLSGEVEILSDSAAPKGLAGRDPASDIDAWRKKGVEAVVEVAAVTAGDRVALAGKAFLVKKGNVPVWEQAVTVPAARLRERAHRLADELIGALTGQDGGFASRMSFTAGHGSLRTAYVMDADGHDPRAVSRADEVAIGTAFGKDGKVYWISSVRDEPYRIRSVDGVVTLPVKGPVYGLAFSKDGSKVAVSIGLRDGIHVLTGSDLTSLQQGSRVGRALEPAFTPGGKLAFSGAGATMQRAYVDGKPISPEGALASGPTFCNHPDGVVAIFAAGTGSRMDLYRTGENGGPLTRLTHGQGENGTPACSPDGRLVAFFSTRRSGEGPGLYVMRVDGRRPKRISTFVGDSLKWDRLPP